jgi:hypothetical protein
LSEPSGLLQIWGIVLLALIALAAFVVAYAWYRANRRRPQIHLDVLAIAVLGLLTGGFFWRPLTENVMMPIGGGDINSFYFPTYVYAASQIKAGSLPLWNPHLFSGMPLAADVQTGLFYPINWVLFLFVNVDYGSLEWLLIFHYWLASVFTYLFLRDLGLSRTASLAGGVVFAFCGFMTAHFGHLPMIPVATWIPAALLAMRRAYVTPSLGGWVWAVVAGLCLTMSLLAGHVQIFSYGLIAVGVLWLYLIVTEQPLTWSSAWPWVGKGAVAVLVMFGLGAMQLLPSVELSSESVRSAISYEEAGAFSAQPITLLNLFLPRVYGGNPAAYVPSAWQSTENWGYCGVVTLALASAGLVLRRNRMVGFFAILSILALVIMVGNLSIINGWMYRFLPGFSSLRSSGRALVLLGLGLAGLAAFGLDGLLIYLRGSAAQRRRVMWWLVGVTVALAVAVLLVAPLFFTTLLQLGGTEYSRLPNAVNDLGMLILWIGVLVALGWAALRGRISHRVVGIAIALLLVLDIFSPNTLFNPTPDNLLAGYQDFAARSFIFKANRNPAINIPYRLDSDANAQDVWQPSTALLMSADPTSRIYDTGGAFNPLKLRRYDYLWGIAKTDPDSPLYDLTGAHIRVMAPESVLTNTLKWSLAEKHQGFNLWQNANAVPHLYLVHQSVVEPDGFTTVDSIRRFKVDARHTVMLESGEAVQSDLPSTVEQPAEGPRRTESVVARTYDPQNIVIDVDAAAPGWVVLTDAWYPGWQATIDGRSVPVQIAYHAYRAIKVDAGKSTITMQFRPATWDWGRLISLLTLLGVIAALIVLTVLPRRARRVAARRRPE